MRKILIIVCICFLLCLCACKPVLDPTVTTENSPVVGTEDQSPVQDDPQNDWELPIDIDGVTEDDNIQQGTNDGAEDVSEPTTTAHSQSEEQVTENGEAVVEQTTEITTEQLTDPVQTEPVEQTTEPENTEPADIVPVVTDSSGAIELPMIPG